MGRPTSTTATIIVAAAMPSLGIGKNGQLPWRLKREMQYFRQVTTGGVVIMGRKTWESIPSKFRPLKDRLNIVISRGALDLPTGCVLASSLDDALESVQTDSEKPKPVFIIGGAQLYAAALDHPSTTRILLTEVSNVSSDFDTFFPLNSTWKKRSRQDLLAFIDHQIEVPELVQENGMTYQFTLYEKD